MHRWEETPVTKHSPVTTPHILNMTGGGGGLKRVSVSLGSVAMATPVIHLAFSALVSEDLPF